MAQLSDTDLNLIKLHKVPTFPDNQNYTLESVWTDDFDVRYVGFEANGATILGPRSDVAMNDIKLQPDGSAIILTVARPSALDAADRLALMEKARAENWNLMISAGEGSEVAPFLTYRNKLAQDSFAYSISAIPCFIGVLVMVAGVGLFGTLSGFLANSFLSPPKPKPAAPDPATDTPVARLAALKRMIETQEKNTAELKTQLEELEKVL